MKGETLELYNLLRGSEMLNYDHLRPPSMTTET